MSITPEDVSFLKEKIADYDLVVLQLEIPMEINELVAAYAYEKGVPGHAQFRSERAALR